jgi:uncharacterized damage-inducible protein DinB
MGQSLAKQFDEAFDLLESAVKPLTDEQWRQGGSPYDGPGRATLHALQAGEFYTHGRGEVFQWQGKGVWEMSDDELPDQPEMLAYLERVREATRQWIARLDEQALSASTPEAGEKLGSAIYAIRHLQHHTGELCAWMKQFGHPQEQWV